MPTGRPAGDDDRPFNTVRGAPCAASQSNAARSSFVICVRLASGASV